MDEVRDRDHRRQCRYADSHDIIDSQLVGHRADARGCHWLRDEGHTGQVQVCLENALVEAVCHQLGAEHCRKQCRFSATHTGEISMTCIRNHLSCTTMMRLLQEPWPLKSQHGQLENLWEAR